jgi:hypothetical protein
MNFPGACAIAAGDVTAMKAPADSMARVSAARARAHRKARISAPWDLLRERAACLSHPLGRSHCFFMRHAAFAPGRNPVLPRPADMMIYC